jgi:hypothetical protein
MHPLAIVAGGLGLVIAIPFALLAYDGLQVAKNIHDFVNDLEGSDNRARGEAIRLAVWKSA